MPDTRRAQLIHIDVDRRLGHEWDEWDGQPLPNRGDFDSAPRLFFAWSAAAIVVGLAAVAALLFILDPRTRPAGRSSLSHSRSGDPSCA